MFLQKSLGSEQKAVEDRFERAEAVLAIAEARKHATAAPAGAAAARPQKAAIKPVPVPRPKVLRRTFALTEDEYRLIFDLRSRCTPRRI